MACTADELRKIQVEALRKLNKNPIVLAEVDAIMAHMVDEIRRCPTFTSFSITRIGTIIDLLLNEFEELGFTTTRMYAPCDCIQYRAEDGSCSCGNEGREGVPCVGDCAVWRKATPHADTCASHTCTGLHVTW